MKLTDRPPFITNKHIEKAARIDAWLRAQVEQPAPTEAKFPGRRRAYKVALTERVTRKVRWTLSGGPLAPAG